MDVITQHRLVPNLRFRDFNDNWELRQLFDFLIPEFRKRNKPVNKYLSIGIRSHCKGTFQKPNSDPSKIAMDNLFLVKENDLIVNITFAWEGAIALVKKEDEGGFVSHRFPTYLFNRSEVLYEFFKYIIIQKKFRYQLNIKSPGGAGRNRVLSKKDFLKIQVKLPSIPEQQKVSLFLIKVDEKLQKLAKKKELLEKYKKGVMQQLFSYKRRLVESGELRKGTLGDFGFFYYGKGAPKTTIVDGADTPCVRYGELYSKYNEEIKNIKSYTNVNPKELKLSKGGEVLVPRVGENPLEFANCSYLPFPNVAIGEMISVYNTKEDGVFMTFYINSVLKYKLARLVEGGNVSNLYFRYVETIDVEIPALEEQQKIANFLSDLNNKIEFVNTQIDYTNVFKKGLLQQLFV